ncbi:hypothetical protein Sste5346_003223 [Sporothrix stenoceras]|uniref:Ubiquinone biosynthesis protein n=1 Tax=Sporothrix stenoceras TaxID=5173 RepID=A0ABR3ZG76_9PEZI
MLSRVSSMVATAGTRASSTAVSTAASAAASTSSTSSPRLNAHAHSASTALRQNWLYESFLNRADQYERLATGTSPHIGVAALGYALITPYIQQDLLPEAASAAGLVNGHPAEGLVNGVSEGIVGGGLASGVPRYPDHIDFELHEAKASGSIGARIKKLHTWPLIKKELNMWQFQGVEGQ